MGAKMIDTNEQFSVRQGDVEFAYHRRPDGTLYATTRAVASAGTGWVCGGLLLLAVAVSWWWNAKHGIAAGSLVVGHNNTMYRVADSARFDAQVKLDLHIAAYAAALAAACIAIGAALRIRERLKDSVT